MRRYSKPMLDIVEFDNFDVVTMSGAVTLSPSPESSLSPSPSGQAMPGETNPVKGDSNTEILKAPEAGTENSDTGAADASTDPSGTTPDTSADDAAETPDESTDAVLDNSAAETPEESTPETESVEDASASVLSE